MKENLSEIERKTLDAYVHMDVLNAKARQYTSFPPLPEKQTLSAVAKSIGRGDEETRGILYSAMKKDKGRAFTSYFVKHALNIFPC